MSRDLLSMLPRRARKGDEPGRGEPSLADVDRGLRTVADVIRFHPLGRNALPIFERLERERERLVSDDSVMQRAAALSRSREFDKEAQ